MTLLEVLAVIDQMGCQVIGGKNPSIRPPKRVEHRDRFDKLLPWLKQYKDEILAHFEPPEPEELCRLCSRSVGCQEDKERLAGVNPFCSWFGIPPRWNKASGRQEPGEDGCPYRTGSTSTTQPTTG